MSDDIEVGNHKIRRRTKKIDNQPEQIAIVGMVTNDNFLSRFAAIYQNGLFSTEHEGIIASWCVDYFNRYQHAPRNDIQHVFKKNKGQYMPEVVELIEKYLSNLSDTDKFADIDFDIMATFDRNLEYFDQIRRDRLLKEAIQLNEKGELEAAQNLMEGHTPLMLSEDDDVDPRGNENLDIETINKAFPIDEFDDGNHLFSLPGHLGMTIGNIQIGDLVAFVAAPNVGKTWWLIFIALWAEANGYDVVFFTLEMSAEQIVQRFNYYYHRCTSRKYQGPMLVPVFDCKRNQFNACKKACNIRLLSDDDKKPIYDEAPRGYVACNKFCNNYKTETWWVEKTYKYKNAIDIRNENRKMDNIFRRKGQIRIVPYASGTLTTKMMRSKIDRLWFKRGFRPKIIITDYADKFKMDGMEYRHSINKVWEDHKALAQELEAGVCTASQSNTIRTGKDIKSGDWAEDIRKMNLVDLGAAINQNDYEKENGIYRFKSLKQRHDDYSKLKECIVTSNLKIGRPYLDSRIVV